MGCMFLERSARGGRSIVSQDCRLRVGAHVLEGRTRGELDQFEAAMALIAFQHAQIRDDEIHHAGTVPIPRLTSVPGSMTSGSAPGTSAELLDPLLIDRAADDSVHEDARSMYTFRVQAAGRHDLLGLGHRYSGRRCHVGIQVACRFSIHQIPGGIGLPCFDDG